MDNRENYIREVQCIGLRIAYFRKLRRMTQADLAQAVHINKNYLSHIESGSASKVISLPLLIMISKALDVDLPILVDIDDLEGSKREIQKQFNDMRELFEEMKQFNDELDAMMTNMTALEKLSATEQ